MRIRVYRMKGARLKSRTRFFLVAPELTFMTIGGQVEGRPARRYPVCRRINQRVVSTDSKGR